MTNANPQDPNVSIPLSVINATLKTLGAFPHDQVRVAIDTLAGAAQSALAAADQKAKAEERKDTVKK